jgi:hypothetical protein
MPVKDKNINNTIKTIKLKTNLNRYIEVPLTMIKGSIRRGIIDDFIYIENSNVVCDHITINNNLDGESYEDPCEEACREPCREPYEEPCREQSKIVKSTIDNLPIVVGSALKAIKILQNRQK